MTTEPIIPPELAHTLFVRALELLEAPNIAHNQPYSWIKGALALDKNYRQCEPESDLAVTYCELGVMRAVTAHLDNPTACNNYLVSLFNMANPNVIAHDTVPAVNDASSTDFSLVKRMFLRAINLTDKLINKQEAHT